MRDLNVIYALQITNLRLKKAETSFQFLMDYPDQRKPDISHGIKRCIEETDSTLQVSCN